MDRAFFPVSSLFVGPVIYREGQVEILLLGKEPPSWKIHAHGIEYNINVSCNCSCMA